MRRFSKWLTLIVILALYVAFKGLVDDRVLARKDKKDIRYLPTPRIAQILSFDYQIASADLFWIEALNYFGGELGNKNRTYKYLTPYLELIYSLDPYFTTFYDWGATSYIYNAMPITDDAIIASQKIVNKGIQHLHEIGRYDEKTLLKGAFNYALEAKKFVPSVDYFEMAARIYPARRDMLLVASTYLGYASEFDRASELKLEYLGYLAFEATNRKQIFDALAVLSSGRFNSRMSEFIRTIRSELENDEDVKKIVETRLRENPMQTQSIEMVAPTRDKRLNRVLQIDTSRSWLNPELNVLLSL